MKPALLLVVAIATLQAGNIGSFLFGPKTTLPTIVRRVKPEYTKAAIEAKLHGRVALVTVIGIDGVPSEITVLEGLEKGLDERAVECLRQWRFKPGARDGKPAPLKVAVEVDFRLPRSAISK